MDFQYRGEKNRPDDRKHLSHWAAGLFACGGQAYICGGVSSVTGLVAGQWTAWIVFTHFYDSSFRGFLFALEVTETFLLLLSQCFPTDYPSYLELISASLTFALQAFIPTPSLHSETIVVKHYALWSLFAICSGQRLCFFHISALLCAAHTARYRLSLESKCQAYLRLSDKAAENAYKSRFFIENHSDVVIELISEGEVLGWNSAASRILGRDNSDVRTTIQRLDYEPCSGAQARPLWEDVCKLLKSSSPGQLLGTTHLPPLILQWRISKCDAVRPSVFYLCASDVTALTLSQRSLSHDQSCKRALIDSISHELRTPTNAIVNLTRDISERFCEGLPSQLVRDLELTRINAQLLLGMVDTIRDFSMILSGSLVLRQSLFDLCAELNEICNLFRPQCAAKSLYLSLNLDPYIPAMLLADKARLREVLLILIGNAVKYTNRGGVKVVAGIDRKGRLAIEVRDTGVGLCSQDATELMSLWSACSGDAQLTRKAGLGLGIANCIAESLGGKGIKVSECVGGGTSFVFKAMVNKDPEGLATQVMRTESAYDVPEEIEVPLYLPRSCSSENDLRYLQPSAEVLIVDDNPFNRLILSKLLATFSIPSIEAENGLKALSLIRKSAESNRFFRLILMDLDMPVMDGITAAKAIDEMKSKGEIPESLVVVACSAYSSEDYQPACAQVGMQTYIEKPVSRDSVKRLLSSLGIPK